MFGHGNEEILKGDDPWGKKERANKKTTLKEWFRDYCQDYHWDRELQLKYIIPDPKDEEADGYVPPSFKLFMYNVYRKFMNNRLFYYKKTKLQRIFRSNHLADCDLWEARTSISIYCLKVLKAFKKYERNGYPGIFSEYSENEWKSIEEYNEAIENGSHLGGGEEAWEKILDHIIMAFEYNDIEGSSKDQSKWFIKYFGMDPYDETNPCNKHETYHYKSLDGGKNYGCTMSSTKPDLDTVEWAVKDTSYHNMELVRYAEHCVQEGFKLFGEYLNALWD